MSEKRFNNFRRSFPFSCIDLIVLDKQNKFLLVRRNIPPYKGKWCLPGGIIRYGEKMIDAINRIAQKELGIEVELIREVGFFEKIFQERHDISHCFLVRLKSKIIKLDFQATRATFFSDIPKQIASFHKEMIKKARLID